MKSRNRSSCARIPRVGLDLFEASEQTRSCALAARIADQPGAAADERDRRWPNRCSRARLIKRQQRADVKARGRRIEPDIGGDPRGSSTSAALGGVLDHAAPLQPSKKQLIAAHYYDLTAAASTPRRGGARRRPRTPRTRILQIRCASPVVTRCGPGRPESAGSPPDRGLRRRIRASSASPRRAGPPGVRASPALDGLRVGLITDIHHSATVSADDVTRAGRCCRRRSPISMVLGGDYVTFGNRAYVEPVAELLAPLAGARTASFAVLGNHDDDRDMPAALARRASPS